MKTNQQNPSISIDLKSKEKAYSLFPLINNFETGTIKSLCKIHKFIFENLYSFAGKIRTKNISKNNFKFADSNYLQQNLKIIEKMPENTLLEIVKKYIEMNIAHPFLEGNGRSTRIWLDLMLRKNLHLTINWKLIDKTDYFEAIKESVINENKLFNLIKKSLSNELTNEKLFKESINTSYYYEEI